LRNSPVQAPFLASQVLPVPKAVLPYLPLLLLSSSIRTTTPDSSSRMGERTSSQLTNHAPPSIKRQPRHPSRSVRAHRKMRLRLRLRLKLQSLPTHRRAFIPQSCRTNSDRAMTPAQNAVGRQCFPSHSNSRSMTDALLPPIYPSNITLYPEIHNPLTAKPTPAIVATKAIPIAVEAQSASRQSRHRLEGVVPHYI